MSNVFPDLLNSYTCNCLKQSGKKIYTDIQYFSTLEEAKNRFDELCLQKQYCSVKHAVSDGHIIKFVTDYSSH